MQSFPWTGVACNLPYHEDGLLQPLLLQEAGAAHNSSTDSSSDQPQQPARMSLLQAVRAPSRVWLQSFFADLKPDKRQVSRQQHCYLCLLAGVTGRRCMLVIYDDCPADFLLTHSNMQCTCSFRMG
jgi:hypothetical protein